MSSTRNISGLFNHTLDSVDTCINYLINKGTVNEQLLDMCNHCNWSHTGNALKQYLDECTQKAKSLLRRGADPNYSDSFKRTPLFNAVKSGHYPLVSVLIENGAELFHRSSGGPHHYGSAIEEGFYEIFSYSENRIRFARDLPRIRGIRQCIDLLLEKAKAKDLLEQGPDGVHSFARAVEYCDINSVKKVLCILKRDLTQEDFEKHVLEILSKKGAPLNQNIASLLLNYIDLISINDGVADHQKFQELNAVLMTHAPFPNGITLSQYHQPLINSLSPQALLTLNHLGLNFLHQEIDLGHIKAVQMIIDQLKEKSIDLEEALTKKDSSGKTPLDHAETKNIPELVNTLKGALWTSRAQKFYTLRTDHQSLVSWLPRDVVDLTCEYMTSQKSI